MAKKLPKKVSVEYYKAMLRQIRLMEKLTMKAYEERIVPLLLKFEYEVQKEASVELKTNARILGGLSERLRQLHELTLSQISGEFSSISMEVQRLFNREQSTGIAKKFVNKINIVDKQQTTKAIVKVGGAKAATKLKALDILQDRGIQSIAQSAVSRNVGLIQSIPQQYLQRVQDAVYSGLADGTGTKAIGKDIADIGGVTERRGQFIARDQLGTVNGEITKKRQQSLGLKKFVWLTSQDERVRDSHKPLDGKTFEWDKGATGSGVTSEVEGLMPGEDFNCRCTSDVVDDDIYDLLDSLSDN